jgi:glycosyltransferase involved in cell wall biosynthesis
LASVRAQGRKDIEIVVVDDSDDDVVRLANKAVALSYNAVHIWIMTEFLHAIKDNLTSIGIGITLG